MLYLSGYLFDNKGFSPWELRLKQSFMWVILAIFFDDEGSRVTGNQRQGQNDYFLGFFWPWFDLKIQGHLKKILQCMFGLIYQVDVMFNFNILWSFRWCPKHLLLTLGLNTCMCLSCVLFLVFFCLSHPRFDLILADPSVNKFVGFFAKGLWFSRHSWFLHYPKLTTLI